MNILEFMDNKELMGQAFQGDSWETWRAVLSGAFALPLEGDQLKTFTTLAGGRNPPLKRVRELYIIAGRRSAKSQTAAAMAVYLATVGALMDNLDSTIGW